MAVRMSRFWRFLEKNTTTKDSLNDFLRISWNQNLKHFGCTGNVKPLSPVLAKDRVVQDNLLQKLDELIGKVSGHEGLDCDRHLLWILGLRQSCLDNL